MHPYESKNIKRKKISSNEKNKNKKTTKRLLQSIGRSDLHDKDLIVYSSRKHDESYVLRIKYAHSLEQNPPRAKTIVFTLIFIAFQDLEHIKIKGLKTIDKIIRLNKRKNSRFYLNLSGS